HHPHPHAISLQVRARPWAATAAVGAAEAHGGINPAMAHFVPARQDSTAPAASAPASGARAGGGDHAMSMVNQIQMLKQQNRELLGQVEQLRHQLQQLKEINKEQYMVLDRRIKRLAGKASSASDGGNGSAAPAE